MLKFKTYTTPHPHTTLKEVRDTHEAPAILLSAAQSQSLAGKKDASFVMRKINSKTGLTAAKARAAIVKPPEKEMTKIAPQEGLGFLLDNNFSRGQYKAV
jgi:hypothetical protein